MDELAEWAGCHDASGRSTVVKQLHRHTEVQVPTSTCVNWHWQLLYVKLAQSSCMMLVTLKVPQVCETLTVWLMLKSRVRSMTLTM